MAQGKTWQLATLLMGVALSPLLTGCNTVVVHGPAHVRGALAEKERNELAKTNAQMGADFKEEALLYPSSSIARPKACMAFSGGGIRSAAFSIGVMKGLHQLKLKREPGTEVAKGYFDQIDVMSGASGGAYAVTWYYMNQMKGGYTRDSIFNDPPKDPAECTRNALCYLQEHADFIDTPFLTMATISDGVLVPLNLLANGLFGWHWNTSFVATSMYEYAITRTFHNGHAAELKELLPYLEARKKANDPLPVPIVTATWRVDEDSGNEGAKLSNTVFEVTPLRYGSEGLRYSQAGDAFPFVDVAELVEVSGSAVDTTQGVPGASERVVFSALNIDTGRFFDNDYKGRSNGRDVRGIWQKLGWYASPFPAYFLSHAYLRDAYGERIYLSDGGHAENLAAWPVIRRLCENIIIVDAEYDPDYTFGSYFRLKHAVEREMHVAMQLQPEADHVDVEKIEPDLEQGRTLKNLGSDAWKQAISAKHYPHAAAVLGGSIGPFPVEGQAPGQVQDLTLNVTYIKMALDESMDDATREKEYGPEASAYFKAAQSNTCEKRPYLLAHLWPCAFPQYSTAHQNFSPEQFAAYVGLGEHIVQNQIRYEPSCHRLVPRRWAGCSPPK
ncbi:MAG: patatin-like phospholipase family protein [Nitrospirae bacterium]|nr:patatin-like phospholipase family protein [Nitrospirota bacterium]